jgi:CRP-like cAMP-binding protein/SAM-dependent methyltransferase
MRSGLPFAQSGLTLLSELSDSDLDWIFSAGKRERTPPDGVVVSEGTDVGSFYLVLQGLVSVYLSAVGGKELATLGAGQTVGEMSLLEDRPAAASVKALEETELLVIPRLDLSSKLEDDPAFAARLYKALAMVTSRRLRETVGTVRRWLEDQPPAEPQTLHRWQAIANQTQRFKERLVKVTKNPAGATVISREAGGGNLRDEFEGFCNFVNSAIGDQSAETIDAREELGARIQREVLPYLLKSETIERFYTKPRGYSGDFHTTELLYRHEPAGEGAAGLLLDRCFLDLPFVAAVRGRRDLIADEIARVAGESKQKNGCKVTAIGSGPADELFAALGEKGAPLRATCIDFDRQALASVAAKRDALNVPSQIDLLSTNLFDLATGRIAGDLANQDFVYSITLPDYFDDKLLIKLLNAMHRLLKPGGQAVIASFHPSNPFKAFMDYIIDWKVTHRSEESVRELFAASAFGAAKMAVRYEPRNIIFLAECKKA